MRDVRVLDLPPAFQEQSSPATVPCRLRQGEEVPAALPCPPGQRGRRKPGNSLEGWPVFTGVRAYVQGGHYHPVLRRGCANISSSGPFLLLPAHPSLGV